MKIFILFLFIFSFISSAQSSQKNNLNNLFDQLQNINNSKSSITSPEPKKEVQDIKGKTEAKTIQEIDREKLEQQFSKDKKETLN